MDTLALPHYKNTKTRQKFHSRKNDFFKCKQANYIFDQISFEKESIQIITKVVESEKFLPFLTKAIFVVDSTYIHIVLAYLRQKCGKSDNNEMRSTMASDNVVYSTIVNRSLDYRNTS